MKQAIFKSIENFYQIRNWVLNKINPPIIVLMYHRVLTENKDKSPFTVTTENFKKQIEYLQKNYDILKFDDEWSKVKKPSFIITFDDGYYDNYLIAKNFLNKENVPATFFISTSNIDSNDLFWWDEISLHKDYYEKNTQLSLDQITRQLIYSTRKEQDQFLSKHRPFYSETTYSDDDYRSMTAHELRELAHLESITIGCHSVNHPKLGLLNEADVLFELSTSKNTLENITGQTVSTCSYPYGSYNKKVINVCRGLGLDKVATTTAKNCYPWTPQMEIPRITATDDGIDTFKRKVEQLLS